MMLIADGGSTKTDWCLIDSKGKKHRFDSQGYNPYFISENDIAKSLQSDLPPELPWDEVKQVYFYGAGVHNEGKASILKGALKGRFLNATIEVAHDLLAAARALLSQQAGFAAILGTGTNTCIYDGEKIVQHIDSTGYILGDEGSGCHIGKKLLNDYLRGYMPEEVRSVFYQRYQLTPSEVMDAVYSKPMANRFCASFSKFVSELSIHRDYTMGIVNTSFDAFFTNLVSRYPDHQMYSFNCIGSVGYGFREMLEAKIEEYGMTVGKIIQGPIDNLVDYHLRERASDHS